MILRRVIEHVRTQNWTAVLLDFLIVVLGVFLGIQVNGWDVARKDRLAENDFYRKVKLEINDAQEASSRIYGLRNATAVNIRSAMDVLFLRGERKTLTKDECVALWASGHYTIPIIQIPSFDQLVSTGRVNIIRKTDLRDTLVSFSERTKLLNSLVLQHNERANLLEQMFPDLMSLEAYYVQGDEMRSRLECDEDGMRKDRHFLNAASLNAERYDAYYRDGLLPWVEQLDRLKQLASQ
ncbi:MAG: hypothetical protein AAF668_05785 [Pseudomonadota bacterium]